MIFFDALTFKDITLRKNSEIFTLKVARTRGKLLQTRTFQTEKFEIVEFPHKAFSHVTCAHTIWPLQICRHRQELISVHKVQALSSLPCPAVTRGSVTVICTPLDVWPPSFRLHYKIRQWADYTFVLGTQSLTMMGPATPHPLFSERSRP